MRAIISSIYNFLCKYSEFLRPGDTAADFRSFIEPCGLITFRIIPLVESQRTDMRPVRTVLKHAQTIITPGSCQIDTFRGDTILAGKLTLKEIQSSNYGSIRVASLFDASVVGTETGAPNTQYKMDENTHSKEALETFIEGLAPVVECAEKYGVSMAIEPVWKHIVCTPERARIVLDAIQSPNLRIIFDPVNLLYPGNLKEREELFERTLNLHGDDVAVIHLKDYVPEGNNLKSIAAGTGEMDYRQILSFVKAKKPYIQATLENTANDNAVQSREMLENHCRSP